jgi:hypothetical protein
VHARTRADDSLDAAALIADLDHLLDDFPDLVDGRYFRMIAWRRKAFETEDASARKRGFERMLADADWVLAHSQREDQREQARQVKAQAGEHSRR